MSGDRMASDTGPFALVPEWLLDAVDEHGAPISDRAVRLYAVLARYADNKDGTAFPSKRTLAKRMGCSEPSVTRAIRELVSLTALAVEPRYTQDGDDGEARQTSNAYTILRVPPVTGDTLPLRTGDTLPPVTGDTPGTRTTKEREPGGETLVRARDPIEQAAHDLRSVDRKPVTDPERAFAISVLRGWNELAGQNLHTEGWLRKIISRHREHPELDRTSHFAVIEHALAHPWWKGRATPSVVYGSDVQFDRSLVAAQAPQEPSALEIAEAAVRHVRGQAA